LAEGGRSIALFWAPEHAFFPHFNTMDISLTLELACGRGRHSAKIIDQAQTLTCVDINPLNVELTRRRFDGYSNVTCLVNNGKDLADLESSSFTAVFSYDSMVHFEALDVISYVFEIFRVLKPKGRALLHYSVNDKNPEASWTDNPHGRNFFSESLMRHVADRAGFNILAHEYLFMNAPVKDRAEAIDGLILLEKPEHIDPL
jgi:ubiquinone/menaquinone biosynthesis C-methylase UbiE